jgi:5-methylcytosine-specific restriction endonuclease McrA
VTRSEAKAAGLLFYNEGRRPCPLNHQPVQRRVSTGLCVACSRILGRERRRKDPTKFTALCKEWRRQNPDKVKAVNARRDPEKLRQYAARWRAENPEKYAALVASRDKQKATEAARRWRERQPKKIRPVIDKEAAIAALRAARSAWRKNNPEKDKEARARYRAKHQEALRVRNALYRQTHPVPPIDRRVREARRRTRKTQAGGSYTKDDVIALMALQAGKCAYCRKSIQKQYAVDHIIPVRLNGSSNRHNLQLVCRICNSSKGGKHPLDYAKTLGLLV